MFDLMRIVLADRPSADSHTCVCVCVCVCVCTKPELVGHRPHFLLGLGGTGTRWDIISGTPFYT